MQDEPQVREGDQIDCFVTGIVPRKLNGVPVGLIARSVHGYHCFVPRSLLPAEVREDLDKLVYEWFQGIIRVVDSERQTLVLEPTKLLKDSYTTLSMLRHSKPEYLETLLANLDNKVAVTDKSRYLGPQNARNLLVAICKVDFAFDVAAWRTHIFGNDET